MSKGSTSTPQKKLAAILAVDVAGYSAFAERDQTAAAAYVTALWREAGEIAEAHGGRIFNTAGDGAMLEFVTASDALMAAIALFESARDPPLRQGLHLGEVLISANGDLLGHGVNVAARLQAAADPGAILVSQIVRDTVQGALADRLNERGRIKLPKMRSTIGVFSVLPPEKLQGAAADAQSPTLAVLPFDNLSRDQDTRFFSDGVSEEILYTVSRVKGLKVIGSTSSFAFRGREKKNAARALHATHILDGSVRRSGERVRISAQLIEAEGGAIVWSERYDRALDDVFALQEDIACEVAAALTLALSAARTARQQRITASVFDAYLRAREHLRSGAPLRVAEAERMLSDIVREAPEFARGWSA
ncbi:MAG: adenylate/guanylate cyclase domain-containing protein, partial [Hyphomonadaceae bacterium]